MNWDNLMPAAVLVLLATWPVAKIGLAANVPARTRLIWGLLALGQIPLFILLGITGIYLADNPHSMWGGLILGALFGPWGVWSYFHRRVMNSAAQSST